MQTLVCAAAVVAIAAALFVLLSPHVRTLRLLRSAAPIGGGVDNSRRVVWVTGTYLPERNAGSEQMAHRINRFLVSQGVPVLVITYATRPSVAQLDGVELAHLTEDRARWGPLFANAGAYVTQYDNAFAVGFAFAALGLPLVEVLHEDWCGARFRAADLVTRASRRAVYNSEWLARAYRVPGVDSFVLRPPVDYREFPRVMGGTHVTLLNLSRRKGGDVFARIAAAMPDVPFLGVSGHYCAQVLAPGVANIAYEPNARDVRDVLQRTRVLLVPSRYETYGQVAVEAMASGIPLVCAPTNGLTEACGEAALYAEPEDVEQWAAHVRRLLDDGAFYEARVQAGFRRAVDLDPAPRLRAFAEWLLHKR